MAWTDPKTWTAGDTITAADLNTYNTAALDYLYDAPRVKTYLTSTQTVLNKTWDPIVFDAESYDIGACWSAGSPSVLTLTRAGMWLVSSCIQVSSAAVGQDVRLRLHLNSGTYIAHGSWSRRDSAADPTVALTTMLHTATTTDELTLSYYSDTGTGTISADSDRTWLAATWLGS